MSFPILETWSNAVNSHNIEDVLSLYDQDAVLVATFSPVPLTSNDSIKSYFENRNLFASFDEKLWIA